MVFNQRREITPFDRILRSGRDAIKACWLEHIDSRIDRIAGDFVWVRFFKKATDATSGICFNQAISAGVVNGRKYDRGCGALLAVIIHDRADVDFG